MEDTLRVNTKQFRVLNLYSLNPCCNGRFSQSVDVKLAKDEFGMCLNPCCNGRYSQRGETVTYTDVWRDES